MLLVKHFNEGFSDKFKHYNCCFDIKFIFTDVCLSYFIRWLLLSDYCLKEIACTFVLMLSLIV